MAFNGTNSFSSTETLRHACIHDLVAAQAARSPDASALIFEDRRVSYGELNQRADALARRLERLGVGAESLVAISAERSLEQVIAMLGVLKAGGAYVPVDPAYPDDRLAAILEDARPAALLSQQRLMPRLARFTGPVIFLDSDIWGPGRLAGDSRSAVRADNLAYVIYTSGSTGKPKGVLIEHRSLVNHAIAMAGHFELRSTDRVLQFASLSFDVAGEEIYPTWLSGGCVVLWPITSGIAPVRCFIEFVEDQGITVLNLPAAYWHEWVAELARVGIPRSVRLVVTGSDKVSSEKFALWRKQAGAGVRFCAAYGPTEATITSTVFDPAPDFISSTDCMPVGKAIANSEVYVLDQNLQKVPEGGIGELHIGGIGLARGYLNQPELTAERFIRNPFRDENNARLYKTGDLARWLPDGNLEFLGRLDDQLKIRGFRIEVGEIENTLRQHPATRGVVVIGREDGTSEKKLVAYVVVSNDNRPTTEELRGFLQTRLPEYMVPSAFVMLKSLPLTPGGKVDRQQLPPPQLERNAPEKQYLAPRTELERRLVEIWEALLGVRPIGVRDNFFELGGHSLMEMRLVAEVERRVGITLPLATIYYTRTIESLAQALERKKSARPNSLIQPYRTEGNKPPVFSQGGSTHLADHLGQDQPIYWLEHHGSSGFSVPSSIEAMAANYVAEIRLVQPRGPYYLLGYCIGGVLMLEVARRLLAQGEAIGLLCLIEPITPRNMTAIGKGSALPAQASSPLGRAVRFLGKFRHLSTRIPRRYRWAKRIGKRILCDLWLCSGYRLPVSLRDFYSEEKLSQALERYAPPVYPGSFVIFRQPDNGTEEGWRALAAGQVDLHNTWVDHNEFLEEPYVQVIAAKIREQIERAQIETGEATERLRRNRHSQSGNYPRRAEVATVLRS